MVFHTIYGLALATDTAIPGLPVLSSEAQTADVQIHLKLEIPSLSICRGASESIYVSSTKDENGNPILRLEFLDGGEHLALLYHDGTRFAVERRGDEVSVDWPDSLTLEDTAPYVVGPVLGLILRLRGMVPLHASAVAIADHAIAFAGPGGAGKSTIAAALARSGYRVVSDDVVVLNEKEHSFTIPPGYPRVNLWAESAEAIMQGSGALPLISAGWDKHFYPLDTHTQFETRSLPLGAVYILQGRRHDLTAPLIENLTGTAAFVALLGNTYMNYLPDPDKRRREFELLGRVVARVPIRTIQVPADLSTLLELGRTVATDVENLLLAKDPMARAETNVPDTEAV